MVLSSSNTEMLSTLQAPSLLTANPHVAALLSDGKDGIEDLPDNRSSSLSELGDASDEHSEPTPRAPIPADLNDDSEAETERLGETPRKLARIATDNSPTLEHLYHRTPSKLVNTKTIDQEDSSPPAPFVVLEDAPVPDTALAVSSLHSLSMVAASEAASLEFAGKKRKRSIADGSSVDEPVEEPARKRSSTVKSPGPGGSQVDMVDNSEQVDVEVELDNAEKRIEQLAQEEAELEETQANIVAEAISELATVAKHTKPRKGGRRGKRKIDDTGHVNEVLASTEAPDGEGEGYDAEDSGVLDEEVVKKKNAIGELAKIEKKFKVFREKLCDEQIAQYEQELEMLKQPNCIHPEYLAMMKGIDERRAEKIDYEKTLLQYKQKNLEAITTAERHQLHSQYVQTVRDTRENILSECNQRLYELQKGRRTLGVEEVEYSMKLPEKRSDQIRQQTAYNLEVSVLSGVAKYVGFPAAPDINSARPSEIEDDLRAMKIATRPAVPTPYVRPYNRASTTADEAAAEEQFLERTPWANPQHPVHQQSHYQGLVPGPSRAPSQTYQTPAGQRRVVDINATNGSASTIEVNSNPPSSTAGAAVLSNSNSRLGESESPVLQMKRYPGDPTETPLNHGRSFAGLGREAYMGNMLSSPTAQHLDPRFEDQSTRWEASGVRTLNHGGPTIPPGPTLPGRPDARIPLTQRNHLGTVSVGSGNGLFNR
ncbi:Sds3-like-domain-containing protein [Massariosphaeria phaeospora]|uniref:Sds3-like-domain-containing protein n=1 Tax=Massariosphaeria phaeospora TaxID=100035 RepID=A0A7C8IIF5_9PLEO|nr:Sds3-like-domain-containing protein [Massariosphaeria phaeospora]